MEVVMSTNDVIIIGPYRYTVLKREARRMLLSWIESTGIYREEWLLTKGVKNV
jgi:hypothetical protein